MNFFTHLECSKCGKIIEPNKPWHTCPDCGGPLMARYDLESAKQSLKKETLGERESTIWKYHELLPVKDTKFRVSLGEGFTPLLRAKNLEKELEFQEIYIKDESQNPTGSFKSRGQAVAISKAKEFGIKEVSIPSAGNAASAMSAYSAATGLQAHIYMPEDTPSTFMTECKALGAKIHLIKGIITDCAKVASEDVKKYGRYDVSTLKEPYRLEGKKTMGYEIAEQMGWELPDVIIYPTGGGTGLIGMWKAFDEMERLGWIGNKKPRMVTVQPTGCAPIVKAFKEGKDHAEFWEGARTIASGLRVPSAIGDFLMLRVLRESNGTAVAVSDEEIMESAKQIGRTEGIFVCPEAGATLAAFKVLRKENWIKEGEKVVLFNTGTGLKYTHLWK